MRILRRLALILTPVIALCGAFLFWLTLPDPLEPDAMDAVTGDAERGRLVYLATGCASCHMAPGARGAGAELILAGGQEFPSDFGIFYAPNISQDPERGIGAWSALDLANALTRGVSREGSHLYPALPYNSYAKLSLQDVADLHAWLKTLPADPTPDKPHQIGFPFNQRWLLGGWKLLFLSDDWVMPEPGSPDLARGRMLVEAMAHCGECHTPRNALGAMERGRWLQGAKNPSGTGDIPGITPALLGWDEGEIVEYLTSGFTPDYDSAGGHMVHVVENMAQLPESDRAAIAAYLLALPD